MIESRGRTMGTLRMLITVFCLTAAMSLAVFSFSVANAATDTVSNETTAAQTEGETVEIGPALESLSVSYWPEYDKPSVLVIIRGRFDSSATMPATLKIALPRGEGAEVTGVSGLAPDGAHDHERSEPTKNIVDAGDKTILSFDSYYPEFQFELYMSPVSGGGKRDFDFDLPLINEVKALSVDIKKPVRAANFTAIPAATQVRSENGFDNHFYSFSNAASGQEYSFEVSYDRPDSQPSIDPRTGQVDTVGGRTRSTAFIAFMAVLVLGGVALGVWRMQSAAAKPVKARPVQKKSGPKQKAKKPTSASSGAKQSKKNFCSSCGKKIETSSKFCPECGEPM